MQPFTRLDGLVAPLARANVDTDAIIPKQFLKSVRRNGFGPNLFDELRYLDRGEPGQDCSNRPLDLNFPLNHPRYSGAQILLTRENFGCGSSREHAVWALENAGFRALIAPSFADIFYGNCFKNGLLPIVFDSKTIDALFEAVEATMGCRFIVDLAAQTVTTQHVKYGFDIDPFRRHCLLGGLDDIALTLTHAAEISAYETRRRTDVPWLFT